MARGLPRGSGARRSRADRLRAHPAVRGAQRLWPVALAAKQRWDSLTPDQQERYKRMAREYAERARATRRPRRKP